jgi:hypothetical protein
MLVRCYHSVEVLFHHVHMRLMVRFNYDYLVVEVNDTKNGGLSYFACLAYVANLSIVNQLNLINNLLKSD